MLSVDSIRHCLEGAIPGSMATCDADGTPNVAFLSQVEYVDSRHIALSFQFFNRTRENILLNPRTRLMVIDPRNGTSYRLDIEYLRTEVAGPLFERMKAKLAGIASHTGMAGVFRLRGADTYYVHGIESVPSAAPPAPAPQRSVLAALHTASDRLRACNDLDNLFDTFLDALDRQFGIEQAMIFLMDQPTQRLYAVASRGYESSGVGAEIPIGAGIIGVAAQARTPIRIGHMTSEYTYGRAVREAVQQAGLDNLLAIEIPLPGLIEPRSQMAVPLLALDNFLGVIYVESTQDLRFGYDEEDALVALAAQLALSMLCLQQAPENANVTGIETPLAPALGAPVEVRYYRENCSVFLDGDYLIKGVAGAIFWALAQDYVQRGRSVFSNRELRLDPRIRLPELSDNLEARLILLTKRLDERNACVRIEKCGRGQIHLSVERPLTLIEASAG
jgi:GAF domain-containing protein/pyridoxamine 5'-phosphate oxidase-like protein